MNQSSSAVEFEAYDRLAELARSEQPDQSVVAPLAATVLSDLRRRAREAATPAAPPAAPPQGFWRDLFVVRLTPPRYGAGTSPTIALVVVVIVLVSAVFQGPWVVFISVALLGMLVILFEARRALSRRAERGAKLPCPRCGYDLSGLPDAIPKLWVADQVGPQRCPECAAPWPKLAHETSPR